MSDPEIEEVQEEAPPQPCFVDTNVLVYAVSSGAPFIRGLPASFEGAAKQGRSFG